MGGDAFLLETPQSASDEMVLVLEPLELAVEVCQAIVGLDAEGLQVLPYQVDSVRHFLKAPRRLPRQLLDAQLEPREPAVRLVESAVHLVQSAVHLPEARLHPLAEPVEPGPDRLLVES